MIHILRNPRTLLFLFLLAVGVMLIGPASRSWSLDYDNGGMHPASDCGRNYWLNLFVESGFGKEGCVPVKAVKAEPVNDQAIEEMKQDTSGHVESFDDPLEALRDYVGAILERIHPAW